MTPPPRESPAAASRRRRTFVMTLGLSVLGAAFGLLALIGALGDGQSWPGVGVGALVLASVPFAVLGYRSGVAGAVALDPRPATGRQFVGWLGVLLCYAGALILATTLG